MSGFDALSPGKATNAVEAQRLVEQARRSDNRVAEAAALVTLANSLEQDGHLEDSVSRATEALDLCQDLQQKKGQACALHALARCHFLRGATAEAQQAAAGAGKAFKALGEEEWESSAARILVAATVARGGPGGANAVAAAAREAGLDKAVELLKARHSAKEAAEAFEASSQRRRQIALRLAEVKTFSNRGDHEEALRQALDASVLVQASETSASKMQPLELGLGLTAEVRAGLSRAVELLSKSSQAAGAHAKANALFAQGAPLEEALRAASSSVELFRAAGDRAGELAALGTVAGLQVRLGEAGAAAEVLALSKNRGERKEEISALCLVSRLEASRATELAESAAKLAQSEDTLVQAEALSCVAQAGRASRESLGKALDTGKEVLKIFAEAGEQAGQALSHSLIACCLALMTSKQAVQSGQSARSAARAAESRAAEVIALQSLIFASLEAEQMDEALQAGRDLVKTCRHFDDHLAESWALGDLARLHLASGDPGQAVRTAEDALTAAAAVSGAEQLKAASQAAALQSLARIHGCRGKPAAALRAAERLLELPGRGAGTLAPGRKGEALSRLVAAEAHLCSPAALTLSHEAKAIMNELKDKAGEGAALVVLAQAMAAQPHRQLDSALTASREAASCFRSCGYIQGEAVALSLVSSISLLRDEAQEAEGAAKEALRLFQQAKKTADGGKGVAAAGEARAKQLLAHSQLPSLQPSNTKLFFDEFNCAHLEINELASQESLEAAVATLHNMQRTRKNVRAVVMHLEGTPGPVTMHSYALTSGNFMVGLRAISVPIILAAWGKIAGPSWSLALGCDYRLASQDAEFRLPVTAPPECLGDLVGQAVAAQLCIANGTLDSQAIQEMGILQQVRLSKDDTCRAASEMGKRIASFPGLACRQTMSLLSVPPVKYTTLGAYKLPDPDLIS